MQVFPRTSPESVGIPSKAIEGFLNNVRGRGIELHSLMILRHGKVCAEGWWRPYAPDRIHNVHSFTKSFVSTALGILVDEGRISLDQAVLSFFPEDAPAQASENLKSMNLHHLLSMSTGHHTEPAIRAEKNFTRAFLAWPVEHAPGTWFCYNSCATHMVSRIIHKVTGKTFVEFLQERLFEPMGFGAMECSTMADGYPSGGGGFAMTTEDMCRLAQLYLNGGKWNDVQLVPERWIRTATVPQSDDSNGTHREGNEDWEAGYGYQMWMNAPAHSYRFDGAFGQEALVCPDQDLAIVFTAATHDLAELFRLAWRYILERVFPAPLPENDVAWAQLKDELGRLKLEELKLCGVSWMQERASDRRISLAPNQISPFAISFLGDVPISEPGLMAIKPVFQDGEMRLFLETPDGAHELTAGMDGKERFNTLRIGQKEVEFCASAKWLEQNVLSITWRTMKFVQSTTLVITYRLDGAEVAAQQKPRGDDVFITGDYA